MKNLKTLGFSLLLGLFSVTTQAEQTSQPAPSSPESAAPAVQAVVVDVNKVNINTATAAEIQDKLVGIGAKKAQAIVEYREKHGKFLSAEQLTEVSGIGKATLDKNRERIVVE
ncbi:transporter [Pasteurellaceae bacterium RH1A]|nr:transporter [Pasteurellaceae bacterium RH1A]